MTELTLEHPPLLGLSQELLVRLLDSRVFARTECRVGPLAQQGDAFHFALMCWSGFELGRNLGQIRTVSDEDSGPSRRVSSYFVTVGHAVLLTV